MKLKEYIKLNHSGSQAKFAGSLGVHKQQVNMWIRRGDVVFEDAIYSKRRNLK